MSLSSDSKKTTMLAVINTIANVLSLIAGVVLIPVIAAKLPIDDMGIATTFFSTRNTFAIIMSLASFSYVNKAMLEHKDDKINYIFSVVCFIFMTCVIALAGVSLIKETFKSIFSLDEFLFYWLFVSSAAYCFYYVATYYCTFHNKYIIVPLITIINGVGGPLFSLILFSLMKQDKYRGRVIGLDIAFLIVSLCLLMVLLVQRGKKYKWNYIIETLKFTIPIIPHWLSQMVLTQCDLIMISYYTGADKSGIYGMGHTVGFLALTVTSQIMSAWSPWVYRRLEENNRESIKEASKLIIIIGTYVSIGLLSVSTELINIFLPDVYKPCIYIVPLLVVAMYFQYIYIFIYDLLYYNKNTKQIAAASIVAAVMNLILNMIFIPRFGYIAAGFTTVFSYMLLLILSIIFARKLDIAKTYDTGLMRLCIIIMIVYAIGMVCLVELLVMRYIILMLVTVILIKTRYKDVMVLLKQLK